jgi:methyltransferase
VVFSDGDTKLARNHHRFQSISSHTEDEYTGVSDPDDFLVHLLSYLETPPNLRKHLFPLHANLRTAGTLPSLDLPHHLRADEWCPYREGVALLSGSGNDGKTLVEAGLRIPVTVQDAIPASARVTLKFNSDAEKASVDPKAKEIRAEAVNPDEPREESGYYWGYNVRRAGSLSAVFEECTYDDGYDITIGTSERGIPLESLYSDIADKNEGGHGNESVVGQFKHLLIVFGGIAGLEVAVKNDPQLQELGVKEAKDVFDRWVNLCPGQGSRTIRSEEAIWIGLMGLRRMVTANWDAK